MKILYSLNNHTYICHVVPQSQQVDYAIRTMKTEDYLRWVRDLSIPKEATNIKVVDALDIDREFRNALKPDLTFDQSKCVEITKDRLRKEREPKLRELDIAQLNAEDKAEIAKIKAEKQKLRDVTKNVTIDLNLEQLKALHA